jgi:DNA mismatch repair ATPase MutS
MSTSEVNVTQFVENSSTFEKLSNLLNFYEPNQILFPTTLKDSTLVEAIQEDCKKFYLNNKLIQISFNLSTENSIMKLMVRKHF